MENHSKQNLQNALVQLKVSIQDISLIQNDSLDQCHELDCRSENETCNNSRNSNCFVDSSLSILNYVDMDSEESVLGYRISLIILNVTMYVGIPMILAVGIRKKF